MTNKNKLTKDVAKRFDEASESFSMTDWRDVKQHLANELSNQKKEVIEELEEHKELLSIHSEPKEENAVCIVCIKIEALDQAIQTIKNE